MATPYRRGRLNCRLNTQFASKDCICSSHNLLDIASEYNNIKTHKTICGKWPSTKTFVKYQNCFQIQPKTHTMLFGRKKHPRKTAQIKIVNHFSISKSSFCENRLRVIVRRFLVHPAVKQVDDLQGFDQSDLLVKYWFWPNRSFDQILMGVLVRLKSYWPSLFKLEIFIVHLMVIPHICYLDHLHVGG